MTSLDFSNAVRLEEIRRLLARHADLFRGKDLLEIGSGTGVQLQCLATTCKSAIGIDIPDGNYTTNRMIEILDYDGQHIPFPDGSFDVVFSSNVIEHIRNEQAIHAEMRRVLRTGGVAVHVVPTATCRVLSLICHYPAVLKLVMSKLAKSQKSDYPSSSHAATATLSRWRSRLIFALAPAKHGEFGNWLTEYFLFRVKSWRKRFEANRWQVKTIEPGGLIYSAYYLFGEHISWHTRARWARWIGSSTATFILRPADPAR